MPSHLPLDKLVPVVAGERPVRRDRTLDVRTGRNRSHQPGHGGLKSQCFSYRELHTHLRPGSKDSGLAEFASGQPLPALLSFGGIQVRQVTCIQNPNAQKTQTYTQVGRLLGVKGRKDS